MKNFNSWSQSARFCLILMYSSPARQQPLLFSDNLTNKQPNDGQSPMFYRCTTRPTRKSMSAKSRKHS